MLDDWYFELQKLKNEGLKKGAEKGYTMDCPAKDWFGHLMQEHAEVQALFHQEHVPINKMLRELADLSNMCDLIFEEVYKKKRKHDWREKMIEKEYWDLRGRGLAK